MRRDTVAVSKPVVPRCERSVPIAGQQGEFDNRGGGPNFDRLVDELMRRTVVVTGEFNVVVDVNA